MTPADSSPAATTALPASRFALVCTLFFAWGFLTALNDILVPHLRAIFSLTYAQGALVQFTFFFAYFVAALPSGAVIGKVGFRRGIILGLGTCAAGALIFLPAAGEVSFGLFLTALFVLAVGITLLQVAANPYVTMLGDPRSATSRLNLTQGFNSLGTTLAPAFGGLLILGSRVRTPLEDARAVQMPYVGIALALALLAGLIGLSGLPQLTIGRAQSSWAGFRAALGHSNLSFGAGAIFLYVGAEVSIGSFAISFLEEPTVRGLTRATAARCVSLYWGGAMVGRFFGSALLRRVRPGTLLALTAMGAAVLLFASGVGSGALAVAALLGIGLCNSIMFPTIFALGIEGLGAATSEGSSLLVMAVVGGAVLPILEGLIADRVGIHHAFLPLILAYGYIVFYGLRGSRPEGPGAN